MKLLDSQIRNIENIFIIVRLFGFPIDQTGRGVSIFFYLLSLLMTNNILKQFQFSINKRLFLIAIVMLNPLYIFWSRTFLIETTALFLSLSFVYFIIKQMKTKKLIWFIAAIIFGSLAASTKVTTFAIYFIATLLYFIYDIFQNRKAINFKET